MPMSKPSSCNVCLKRNLSENNHAARQKRYCIGGFGHVKYRSASTVCQQYSRRLTLLPGSDRGILCSKPSENWASLPLFIMAKLLSYFPILANTRNQKSMHAVKQCSDGSRNLKLGKSM